MTVPFEDRIGFAARELLIALRESSLDSGAAEVDDHLLILARGEQAASSP